MTSSGKLIRELAHVKMLASKEAGQAKTKLLDEMVQRRGYTGL
jgi:hypothetical protein